MPTGSSEVLVKCIAHQQAAIVEALGDRALERPAGSDDARSGSRPTCRGSVSQCVSPGGPGAENSLVSS